MHAFLVPLDMYSISGMTHRPIDILSIEVNGVPAVNFTYDHGSLAAIPSVDALAKDFSDTRREPNLLKYGNRWLRLAGDFSKRELDITLPDGIISEVETEIVNPDGTTSTQNIIQPLTVVIKYTVKPEFLNFGSFSCFQSTSGRYIQFMGSAVCLSASDMPDNSLQFARYWMPCLDDAGERVTTWDLEYSVVVGAAHKDVFDRIHVISSGILYRQFINDTRTIKVFQYKLQELPMMPRQLAFVAGVFDAVRVPNVPFAYAFGPNGRANKLTHVVEFLGRTFNFFNWYLNSSGGTVRSLSSASSEVFPFPSYYLVFVKDLPTVRNIFTAANLTLLNCDKLHDATHIDQTVETRRLLTQGLAEQYFRLRLDLKTPADGWMAIGIVRFLTESLLRTFHGNNEYRLQIRQDIDDLVDLANGGSDDHLYIPPISSLVGYLREQAPKLVATDRQRLERILWLKSRLIFVLLERRIEKSFLQRLLAHIYMESISSRPGRREGFSTSLLLKLVKRLTGKDLKAFTDQWIFSAGTPQFTLSFAHNRKRSMIEFEISAKRPAAFKFSGNLLIKVAESDAVHEHTVHIDETTSRFEVPFHSRAKRPRKRKVAPEKSEAPEFDSNDEGDDLMEVGEDWSRQQQRLKEEQKKAKSAAATANPDAVDDENVEATLVSPISWIRLDPEMDWLATFNVIQPDIMLIEQLEGDRDVIAQWEACRALPLVSPNSEAVALALERFVADWKCFWRVRAEALRSLGLIGACLSELLCIPRLLGARKLVEFFIKKYGVGSFGTGDVYPKPNDFDLLTGYFLQSSVSSALADCLCLALEREINSMEDDRGLNFRLIEPFLHFFINLIYYNDNSTNNYADGYYVSRTIRAATRVFNRLQRLEPQMRLPFQSYFDRFTEQLERYFMLEYFLPSFRNAVMCAILESAATLKMVTNPESLLNPTGRQMRKLLSASNYTAVRLEALSFFINLHHGNEAKLLELLQVLLNDSSAEFRKLAVREASFTNLLQNVLKSAEAHNYLLSPFSKDLMVWCSVVGACLTVEGVAVDDNPAAEALTVPALRAIRITLNVKDSGVYSLPVPESSPVSAENEEDDVWLTDLPGAADQATPAGEEKSALLHVWQTLWANYDSIPFRYPVDPSVPGYYAIIRSPMDLSTARQHISSLPLFLQDLRLIFRNCFTFNQPDSMIWQQAERLRNLAIKEFRTAFPKERKMIKRVLMAAQEDSDLLFMLNESMHQQQQQQTTTTSAIPKLAIKVRPPTAPLAVDSSSKAASLLDNNIVFEQILQRLGKHRLAYFFALPVDPVALNLPTYFDVVKQPMDFSTIRKKIEQEAYQEPREFEADVRLIFENCRLFNAPGTMVVKAADDIEQVFNKEWNKLFPTAKLKICLKLDQ